MNIHDLLPHQTDLLALSAGDVLFDEGQPGDTLFVVISGELEVFVRDKVVEIAAEGTLLGELAIINGSARAARVVAKTDCHLMAFDIVRFLALSREQPEFPLYVMRAMADRLQRLGKLL